MTISLVTVSSAISGKTFAFSPDVEGAVGEGDSTEEAEADFRESVELMEGKGERGLIKQKTIEL